MNNSDSSFDPHMGGAQTAGNSVQAVLESRRPQAAPPTVTASLTGYALPPPEQQ